MAEFSRGQIVMRWIGRGVAILLLLTVLAIVFGDRFYNTIQMPYHESVARAEAAAIERLNLKQISEVKRFVGDQPYIILFATNPADIDVIVWVWNDGLHVERVSAGLSEEQVELLSLSESPNKNILRITPGKLRDEYVWEVFYTMSEDSGLRHYYDYYRFSDGVKLDTYRLAKQS